MDSVRGKATMITDKDRARLRAEEIFRAEVRRELDDLKAGRWNGLLAWIKHPASWVTLAGSAVAIVGLFLTQLNPGKLVPVLAQEIGIHVASAEPNADLYIPVTFASTSAQRITRHVLSTTATLEVLEGGHWVQRGEFIATLEYKFVGSDDESFTDVPKYVNRAVPFHVRGGTSVPKVLLFTQVDTATFRGSPTVLLTVVVETLDGCSVTASRQYSCPTLSELEIVWCKSGNVSLSS